MRRRKAFISREDFRKFYDIKKVLYLPPYYTTPCNEYGQVLLTDQKETLNTGPGVFDSLPKYSSLSNMKWNFSPSKGI